MEQEFLLGARQDMEKVLVLVRDDLALVRTGRAKPSLVEKILIEVYGTKMPLVELATISAPEPHLLVVSPWDESIIGEVARGIATSDLNLNPVVDGRLIRISLPPLSSERREELVRLVHQKLESGRNLVRQVRQEAKKRIEGMKDQPGVSEDDIWQRISDLEKLTDEFMGRIAELGRVKEEEVRAI